MLNPKEVEFICFLDQEHIDLHANLLSYRAQLAFFEIAHEYGNEDMGWEEFVLLLRQWEKLRIATKAVIRHALLQFDPKQFDFQIPQEVPSSSEEEESGAIIDMAKILTKEEGRAAVMQFMFLAEASQFNSLSHQIKTGYTWEAYLKELDTNQTLLEALSLAFQDGVRKIDFKKSWWSPEIEETQFLR